MENLTLAWIYPLAAAAVLATGCRHEGRESAKAPEAAPRAMADARSPARATPVATGPLAYARVFSIQTRGDTTMLQVHKPWQGSQAEFTYLLVSAQSGASSSPAPEIPSASAPDTMVVRVPVARAVTLTTTNLRDLETVKALDALVGLGGGRYVCSPEIRARLKSGRIRDVGEDVRLDLESVVALKPDIIFTYVVGNSSDGGLSKLAEAGIPAVVEGSYMEETPLGRAEWIKFTAAFFGKAAAADSVFSAVDSSYRALARLARTAAHRPTVMVGAPFGGVWWVPGGRTYVARLLADAGADYLWASDTTRGSLNLDMEAVLGRAAEAGVWLNAGDWRDLADAKAKDPRNALFRPWKTGRVYANDAVRCEGGGRDFFETGASRPDWILADLISILHPELLPGHRLRWYRRLPGPA
jgi:iron complex transport system substrate-binding protein